MQRHLAAFEPALERVARARLRALVAAAGRLAVARARAAADALPVCFAPFAGFRLLRSIIARFARVGCQVSARARFARAPKPCRTSLFSPPPPGGAPCESSRAFRACRPAPPSGGSAAGPCSATTRACFSLNPIGLFTSVTFSFFFSAMRVSRSLRLQLSGLAAGADAGCGSAPPAAAAAAAARAAAEECPPRPCRAGARRDSDRAASAAR